MLEGREETDGDLVCSSRGEEGKTSVRLCSHARSHIVVLFNSCFGEAEALISPIRARVAVEKRALHGLCCSRSASGCMPRSYSLVHAFVINFTCNAFSSSQLNGSSHGRRARWPSKSSTSSSPRCLNHRTATSDGLLARAIGAQGPGRRGKGAQKLQTRRCPRSSGAVMHRTCAPCTRPC